ncbi:diadenylate cyclase CdaA [candidate division KSB1 bacterium]
MDIFQVGFLDFTFRDLIDILLVAFLLYKLYQVMSGTRAAQMIGGLVLIVIISFVVEIFKLEGMSWIITNIKTVWIILFVIIFQPELRRLLIHAGQSRILRLFVKLSEYKVIELLATAACELSQKRYGGLIVITRETGLKAIIETGTILQAKITNSLIVSIFSPRSPLHDGAVIINEDLIEAAKCILPLTDNPNIEPELGTRHQAALGVSEETDAVVIVVSEESGIISVAHSGKLIRDLNYSSLVEFLSKLLHVD